MSSKEYTKETIDRYNLSMESAKKYCKEKGLVFKKEVLKYKKNIKNDT